MVPSVPPRPSAHRRSVSGTPARPNVGRARSSYFENREGDDGTRDISAPRREAATSRIFFARAFRPFPLAIQSAARDSGVLIGPAMRVIRRRFRAPISRQRVAYRRARTSSFHERRIERRSARADPLACARQLVPVAHRNFSGRKPMPRPDRHIHSTGRASIARKGRGSQRRTIAHESSAPPSRPYPRVRRAACGYRNPPSPAARSRRTSQASRHWPDRRPS